MYPARRTLAAAIALAAAFTATPAHAEPSPTRAKAKATVEFFVPLLLDDSSTHAAVSGCHRVSDGTTWACTLAWEQRPDSALRLTCRAIVLDEPDWVYIDEPTTRCRERRTATRRRGLRAHRHHPTALDGTKPLPAGF